MGAAYPPLRKAHAAVSASPPIAAVEQRALGKARKTPVYAGSDAPGLTALW